MSGGPAGAAVWQGRTAWLGPSPVEGLSASNGRVWRWSGEEATQPGLGHTELVATKGSMQPVDGTQPMVGMTQSPGFWEPGLALLDATGEPVVALGRHPRHHGRPGRTEAWVEQAVIVPTDEGWRHLLTVRDGWETIAFLSAGGSEITKITRRTASGSWRASGLAARDRFTLDGRTYQPRQVRTGSKWSRLVSAGGVVGMDIVDPETDEVRVSFVAEGVGRIGDDVTLPLTVRWFTPPGLVEQGVVLALVGIEIDAQHSIHTD